MQSSSSTQVVYVYNDPNGKQQTITVNLGSIPLQTSFGVTEFDDGTYPIAEMSMPSAPVITSIQLPNGTSYAFKYEQNGFGGLTSVTLPQGGVINYSWATLSNNSLTRRYVTARTVNDGVSRNTWNVLLANSTPSYNGSSVVVATVTDPTSAGNQSVLKSSSGKVFNAAFYAGPANGTPLRNVEVDYATFDGSAPAITPGPPSTGSLPARIITTEQNNQQNRVEYDYDYFSYPTAGCSDAFECSTNGVSVGVSSASRGNVIASRVYDWGIGSPGPLLRQTINKYQHESGTGYEAANVVDALAESDVYDGSAVCSAGTSCNAVLLKKTVYTDDNGTQTGPYRGDATSVARWVNAPTSGYLTTGYSYDAYGNIITETDPNGNTTTYGYADAWTGSTACAPSGNSNAYLTSITNAVGQKELQTFYQCTGQTASVQDANDAAAARPGAVYSYDLMGRLYTTTLPDGGKTQNIYDDSAHTVDVQTLISSGITKDVLTQLDGVGRTVQTQLKSDPSGVDYIDTTYDSMGRVNSVSNPYRSKNDRTYGVTSYTYDALSRMLSETEPSDPQAGTGTLIWNYDGASVTLTNENSYKWQRSYDALGRLTQVLEPSSASVNAPPKLQTDYAYDALGNLKQVDQWGGPSGSAGDRMRSFHYDSLSRLLSSTNPESGAISYTYDPNGNVQTKTDARGITTTFHYDALNRVTGKSYSNDPTGTPGVSYSYDVPVQGWNFIAQTSPPLPGVQQTNLLGRLSSEQSGQTENVYGYDSMGRTTLKSVCTPTTCGTDHFDMHAAYDLAGNTIFADLGLDAARNAASPNTGYYYGGLTTDYDGSGHMMDAKADTVDATHPGTIVSNLLYSPLGGMTQAAFGGVYSETDQYSPRGWITGRTGTIQASGYARIGTLGHDPAGNVTQLNDSLTNGTTTYGTDQLNRLTSFSSPFGAATYGYDPWGNLLTHTNTAGPGYTYSLAMTPQNQVSPTGSTDSAFTYDAAGNVLSDGLNNYSWDAEGRLHAVNGATNYAYGPEGERVATYQNGSVQAEYLYGMDGTLRTELAPGGGFVRGFLYGGGMHLADYTQDGKTVFHLADEVGSLVNTIDQTGAPIESCAANPFGESLNCSGSGVDFTELHFTDKKRDQESGLDYFAARMYGSVFGRWMSPDWSSKVEPIPYAKLDNPQTLNLYAYVGNNPLSRTDPTGHYVCSGTKDQCAAIQTGLNLARAAMNKLGADSKGGQAIGRVLSFYGAAREKNGVSVSFGMIKGGAEGQASRGANGQINIKFDLSAISKASVGSAPGTSITERAGTEIHEGTHGVDERAMERNPENRHEELGTERHAYSAESYVYQGLGVDTPSGLWSPSWSAASAEQNRSAAVEDGAQRSTAAVCAQGCQP